MCLAVIPVCPYRHLFLLIHMFVYLFVYARNVNKQAHLTIIESSIVCLNCVELLSISISVVYMAGLPESITLNDGDVLH